MKTFLEWMEGVSPLRPGTRVRVKDAQGKMTVGKVVRYDDGKPDKSPYYIVDVGVEKSERVPAHEVKEINESWFGNPERDELVRILKKYRSGQFLTDEELAYCDRAYLEKYPAMKATLDVRRNSGDRVPDFEPSILAN